jgi:hypothetical protein
VNIVDIKSSEAQFPGILYYPNPYPNIHPHSVGVVKLADFNGQRLIGEFPSNRQFRNRWSVIAWLRKVSGLNLRLT